MNNCDASKQRVTWHKLGPLFYSEFKCNNNKGMKGNKTIKQATIATTAGILARPNHDENNRLKVYLYCRYTSVQKFVVSRIKK